MIASDVLYVEDPRWGGLDMEELRQFFGAMARKLAPGGLALLSYANRENGTEEIKEAARQNGLLCYRIPLANFMAKGILHAHGATSLAFSIMLGFTAAKDADIAQIGGGGTFSSLVKAAFAEEMTSSSAQLST